MYVEIEKEITTLGWSVLSSSLFMQGFEQKHHRYTSVSDHTLNVTIASLKMWALMEKLHIHTNEKDIVLGTLCHDLGIIGREQKFSNNAQCCMKHPVDSAMIARALVPELNEKTVRAIESHMWPLASKPPNSLEGLIVSLADKYCSIRECFGDCEAFNAAERADIRNRMVTVPRHTV